jgi:pimeloyl-ACP methyl ester carboxylesterase
MPRRPNIVLVHGAWAEGYQVTAPQFGREADGAGDETVLLLNPRLESLFAWDTIWTHLAQTARLVAVDLPGFGQVRTQG